MELPIRTSKRLVDTVAGADLPPMSGIAAQLVATLSEEQADLTLLRDLIAQDPALSASVLRWANSPIYGSARKINTLDGAISILGLTKVRARAIAFFITNAFEPTPGLDRDLFWASCMESAGYAMWIALAAGLDESEAWLTALMVRLGELVIGKVDQPTLLALEATPLPVLQRWQQEQEHFGFNEGEVMAEVSRLWFFPESMAEALQKCAKPMAFMAFAPLAAAVHLAMLLADQEAVDEASLQQLPPDVLVALGIDVEWMAQHIPDRASFTTSKTD